MSSINSVRKLQILYFQYENKKIKNLKNGKKSGPISAFIHTTSVNQLSQQSTLMRGLFNKVSHPLTLSQTLDCIAADTNYMNIYSHIHV